MADFTNVFPNAKQFDTMNALLAVIASKTGESKIDSWYAVQQAVRMGAAPTLFPIGTQLVSERESSLTATVTGSITDASVAEEAFIQKSGSAHGGAYEFVYDGSAWHLNGDAVILADYGITMTGTAVEGDKIVVQEATERIVWDVVAHDYNVDPHGRYEHSMTLLTHICAGGSPLYDTAEALYYCEKGLAPGNYSFTVENQEWYPADNGKSYQFTLTQPVPAGGQLVLSATPDKSLEGKSIKSYASASATEAIETSTLTEGADGMSLVLLDGDTRNLNHMHRALYGSNNWKESAMRQFLNSDAAAGGVWKPQTKFDRPPSWATRKGWMNGLDPQFLDVVGTARIISRTNSVYEVDGNTDQNYTTDDKFWLVSRSELYGGSESGLSDGTQFPFYQGSSNADKVKHSSSGAVLHWWLRSPRVSNASNMRYVHTDGSLYSCHASDTRGVAVACAIF